MESSKIIPQRIGNQMKITHPRDGELKNNSPKDGELNGMHENDSPKEWRAQK